MTLMSPTNYDTVENSDIPFMVRVDNQSAANSVQVTLNGKTTTLKKVIKPAGINFTGTITVPQSANNSAPQAVVKVLDASGHVLEKQNIQLYFKFAPKPEVIGKVPMKAGNLKSNGSWPDIGKVDLTQDDANIKAQFKQFDPAATWQELKFETVNTDPAELSKANQFEISGLIPSTSGHLEAYGLDNQGNKTDYSSTEVDISTLPIVTYEGKQYHKFDFIVNFPENLKQRSLQFGIVGVNADHFDQLILQQAQLRYLAKEAVKNPKLIDDYSEYLGSNHLLDRAYSTNGDNSSVSLVKNSDGTYSMKFTYNIAANHYAGRGMTFATPRNWQGAKGIQLDLKNDVHKGDDLDLQTNMNGVTFEGHIDLGQAHDGVVYVPFTKFAPANWDTKNAGKTINDDLLKNVGTFYFYINSQVEGQRSITVGNVEAVDQAPTPVAPTEPVKPTTPVKPTIPAQPTIPAIPASPIISENNNNSNQAGTSSPSEVLPPKATNSDQNVFKDIVLTHNAYEYNRRGEVVVGSNGRNVLYRKGTTLKAWNNGAIIPINGKNYYQIAENGFVKIANTLRTKHTSYRYYRLTHNAFVYTKAGRAIRKGRKHVVLRRKQLIKAWNNGQVVMIKGKRFYQIGKDQYVKVSNTVRFSQSVFSSRKHK